MGPIFLPDTDWYLHRILAHQYQNELICMLKMQSSGTPHQTYWSIVSGIPIFFLPLWCFGKHTKGWELCFRAWQHRVWRQMPVSFWLAGKSSTWLGCIPTCLPSVCNTKSGCSMLCEHSLGAWCDCSRELNTGKRGPGWTGTIKTKQPHKPQ